MVAVTALWLPILLSAVIVFVASSILHMALPYHRGDYKKLPDEEKVGAAIREAGVQPGLYMFPSMTHADMKSADCQEKLKRGPVGSMTIRPNGPIVMPKFLGLWFGFCIVVSFCTAYAAGITLGPGTNYMVVFRVAGTIAFMTYGVSQLANGIWKGEPTGMVTKEVIDGLVYGLLTAGTFGWLWPR